MQKDILFLLGSGFSVDSCLFTYRGVNKMENYSEVSNIYIECKLFNSKS